MQCHAHISSIKGTRVAGALLDMGQWKQTGFFPHEVNLMVQQKGEKKKKKNCTKYNNVQFYQNRVSFPLNTYSQLLKNK